MVVGVIIGLETTVVASGMVFAPVSDAADAFPIWRPELLAMGWVPITSPGAVEPPRSVLLSLGKPTGIPAAVVVPEFPVAEGGDTGLPVAVLVGLLTGAVSAGFVPGIDTGFVAEGGDARLPLTVLVGLLTDAVSAGVVPGTDTGFVIPGAETLVVVPTGLDTGGVATEGETMDPGGDALVAVSVGLVPGTDTGFVVDGRGALLVVVSTGLDTGGDATDGETVDGFVPGTDTGFEIAGGVDIALAVSVGNVVGAS